MVRIVKFGMKEFTASVSIAFLIGEVCIIFDIVRNVYHLVIYEGRTESHEQQFFVK